MEVAQPVAVIVEEQPVSAGLGTLENPVTDMTKIIAQVQALGEIYQANVLGKSGWFYHRYEDYFPFEFISNTGEIDGIPVAELNPDDTMIRQEWLLIDATGIVLKARYEPPITVVNINNGIFEGAQSIYTFDLSSGAIQQTEHLLQNVDGNSITGERVINLEQGYVDELPPMAAQIMNEAITLAGDAE